MKILNTDEIDKLIVNTFSTSAGKKMLEYLREEFYDRDSVVNDNPYMTYYNEGQRSVVNLINECLKEYNNE